MTLRHKKTGGYTFIEVMVFVALIAIITGAVNSVIIFVYGRYRDTLQASVSNSSTRRSIDAIVTDIRQASFADNGAYPFVSIGNNSVTFYSDSDNDSALEQIGYTLNGTVLERSVINPTGSPPVYNTANKVIVQMIENVHNTEAGVPMFTYYDTAGVEITNMTQISKVASIMIRIITKRSSPGMADQFGEIRTQVTMRNYLGI
jgi:type II secretory pathway component PulJ